jgi:hypothetical protein
MNQYSHFVIDMLKPATETEMRILKTINGVSWTENLPDNGVLCILETTMSLEEFTPIHDLVSQLKFVTFITPAYEAPNSGAKFEMTNLVDLVIQRSHPEMRPAERVGEFAMRVKAWVELRHHLLLASSK